MLRRTLDLEISGLEDAARTQVTERQAAARLINQQGRVGYGGHRSALGKRVWRRSSGTHAARTPVRRRERRGQTGV